MKHQYSCPEEITDEAIKKAFAVADFVLFFTRGRRDTMDRYIAVGNLGWCLNFRRVCSVVGIAPKMLQPVFPESPEAVDEYDQLGRFLTSEESFRKLSQVLRKSIRVEYEERKLPRRHYLFTVAYPSGEVARSNTWMKWRADPS